MIGLWVCVCVWVYIYQTIICKMIALNLKINWKIKHEQLFRVAVSKIQKFLFWLLAGPMLPFSIFCIYQHSSLTTQLLLQHCTNIKYSILEQAKQFFFFYFVQGSMTHPKCVFSSGSHSFLTIACVIQFQAKKKKMKRNGHGFYVLICSLSRHRWPFSFFIARRINIQKRKRMPN